MSRNLQDLHPAVNRMANSFLMSAAAAGIDLLVTCTWRSAEEQAKLYAQGRTAPGPIVTKAKPGQSMHNHCVQGHPASLALDVVPLRNGKPVWKTTDPLWAQVGQLGKAAGLEWAGDWKTFREYPHFQHPDAKRLQGALS